MHAINPRLVRSYDLRGVVGRDLMGADAWGVGARVATASLARGGARIAVGYDGRVSSPALAAAAAQGVAAAGGEAIAIGLGPTGMLYFALHERGLDAGVMVTGSHNPADQNGFKLLLGHDPVHGDALRALVASEPAAAAGGRVTSLAIEDDYVARLLGAAAGAPPLRLAWDPGNGAAGRVVERLAMALPGEHYLLNATIDGHFPVHHPDPSVPENLQQLQALVRRERLDGGIAFDGDGDRIGVVDATGAIVWPDQLLLLLARDVLRIRPGAAIVADVKSSRTLFDGIAAAGGNPVLSRSGYVLVREAMLAAGAPLAGEMSGHIFYADRWHGTDDALHVAMRLLVALGHSGETLAGFRASLPRTFATPELRLPCADERKAAMLAAVERDLVSGGAAIDRTDGLRVTTAEGWWLLRASGTEPKLTARVEAWSEAGLAALRADLDQRLARAEGNTR